MAQSKQPFPKRAIVNPFIDMDAYDVQRRNLMLTVLLKDHRIATVAVLYRSRSSLQRPGSRGHNALLEHLPETMLNESTEPSSIAADSLLTTPAIDESRKRKCVAVRLQKMVTDVEVLQSPVDEKEINYAIDVPDVSDIIFFTM
ncbi:unnamed protein product [Toxocara canis]|uniref:MPN domain-containing protein n=1 Tax=Toxocara canis TaxID=6265 RepID=A0A183UX63_TOXCA|nr:unnamed protein product [Toxocara canis]